MTLPPHHAVECEIQLEDVDAWLAEESELATLDVVLYELPNFRGISSAGASNSRHQERRWRGTSAR